MKGASKKHTFTLFQNKVRKQNGQEKSCLTVHFTAFKYKTTV